MEVPVSDAFGARREVLLRWGLRAPLRSPLSVWREKKGRDGRGFLNDSSTRAEG